MKAYIQGGHHVKKKKEDWSDRATSQETPRIAVKPLETTEKHGILPQKF